MYRKIAHGMVLASALMAFSAASRADTPKSMEDTPLISRDVLFGNPDRASPELSADGKMIAFLADVDGVLNVWVAPAHNPDAARPVTKDTHRGIRSYFWAYDNQHILYIQDKGGDENFHIYATDPKTLDTRDLTPISGVRATFVEVSPKFPGELLVGLNDRNPQYHDVYRVNIATGERELVAKNDEFAGYVTDDDFNIRFAQRSLPDGGMEILKAASKDEWTPFDKIAHEDATTTGVIGFDKTGGILYMTDSRGRDTGALMAVDLKSGEKKVVASNPRSDLAGIMSHPTEKTIEAVAFNYTKREWEVRDEAVKADLAYLKTVADGEVNVTDRTLDDKHWIVAYTMDNGPVRYYLYDRAAKKAKFLFTNRKALEGLPLTKMHPEVIKSRDGLNLVSYLSLPIWADAKGNGRPDKPLPMILMVHGGPWGRDSWGYNPMDQLFTNRGYAVLSVNFRSSTGFGKKFVNAGDLEWAGKMHDDLIDAVDWAIAQKIADPKKVAIMGGSYGGYATLVGLTFTPDKFACGVDIVGPSNLITLINSIPPYWAPMIEFFAKRVGDHRTEEGRKLLTERSPLTYADKIKKPLLIGQGANDPRVKQAEADQIVSAMKSKNIPVTYVLFPDEGHGFARPANNKAFFAVAEAFLAKQLGGRFEPIGDDFNGSTITVPEGVTGVPGLEDAMKTHNKAS